MKKTISVLIVMIMLTVAIPYAKADAFVSDNHYYTIELECENIGEKSQQIYTKTLTYYSSSGQKLWEMSLRGVFIFDGISAICIDSYVSYSVYNSQWQFVSKTQTKSGNTASGSVTMKQVILGITVQTITKSLTITCDEHGNIS